MATIDELRARAELIAEEQQIGGNTAERVGDAFDMVADIIEAVAPGDQQAVLYNPQSPNEAQKAQARANIGAQETISDIADFVKVSAQTFTADQKQQARENIGAEQAGGAVKNLAGSASDTETLIKAANNPNLQANVHLSGNNIYVNGIAGGIDLDNNGVNIKAGNSGYPNAKVKVNNQEVATKLYVDGKIDDRADSIELALDLIEAVIPSQASAQNQLADKNYVNSSISSSTANFVGTFDSLAELQAVQNPTNNDYGFVIETDAVGNEYYDRYKYNGTVWFFEYKVESTPFTAAQWAAIQSGITSALVGKLSALPTNTELATALDAKADKSDTYTKAQVDAAIAVIDVSSQIAGKADKVTNATSGNFAALNASGNLVDSRKKAADFALQSDTYTKAEIGNLITPIDSEVIVGALPATGVANKVYRVPGTDSYTDYGWDGTQFVPLATFSGGNFGDYTEEAVALCDFTIRAFVRPTNGTEGAGNGYAASLYVNCNGAKQYRVVGYTGGASIAVAAFYRADKTFISGVAQTSGVSDYAVDVPSGAVYVRFSARDTVVLNGSYKVTAVYSAENYLGKRGEYAYMAVTGDDLNDGLTPQTAVASFNRAAQITRKTLYIYGGDYQVPRFDFARFTNIIGIGVVRFLFPTDTISSADLLDGYTKVYRYTIPSWYKPSLSSHQYLWQHDVPDAQTLISSGERTPYHKGRTHRLGSTRLTKVASIAAIESADTPSWYADSTYLYFSIAQGSSLATNPVIIPYVYSVGTTREGELSVSNVQILYSSVTFTRVSGRLTNVSIGMTQPSTGAFSMVNCNGLTLDGCEAFAAYAPGGGDGFNHHCTDTGYNVVSYVNCYGHDNADDGESSHENSISTHQGGLYEYNGNGVTPASGASTLCTNVVARNNGAHAWTDSAVEGTGFSAQGNNANLECIGCMSQSNVIGFRAVGNGTTGKTLNCVSVSDTTSTIGTININIVNVQE